MLEILVLIEVSKDGSVPSAKELLAAAARLGTPVAVLVGASSPSQELIDALGELGAEKVVVSLNEQCESVLGAAELEALSAAVNDINPGAVLLSHSDHGKEIAARLAARTGGGLITDSVGVRMDNGQVIVTGSVYGGAYSVDSSVQDGLTIVTMRPGSIEESAPPGKASVSETRTEINEKASTYLDSVIENVAKLDRPRLQEAKTVVSGGRAFGSKQGFELVEKLADSMGAALGASRAAVDSGYAPTSCQVGQTGVTVSPELYMALGISGAIQHKAGMQTAKTVVAINSDGDAPIFDVADFGIVGDVFTLIPQFIELLETRNA